MNFTASSVLGSSSVSHNNEFYTSTDPFYIGMGIGLSGGVLTSLVILHSLYYKKKNKLNNTHNVVFEKHSNVHEIVKTTIDLSV